MGTEQHCLQLLHLQLFTTGRCLVLRCNLPCSGLCELFPHPMHCIGVLPVHVLEMARQDHLGRGLVGAVRHSG